MKRQRLFLLAVVGLATTSTTWAQTLVPTSGTVSWNDDSNWSSAPFPNASGAAAILPAPTAALTVNLNQPISVGSLTIGKAGSGAFDTAIEGPTNTLTFDGGATLVNADPTGAAGTGVTIVDVPLALTAGLTVTQNDNDGLRLMQAISGTGSVNYNRGTSGTGVIAVSGANTYSGDTVLTGNGGQNFLLVRLNNATAIPGGIGATGGTSNLKVTNSAIIALRSDDFKRSVGTGPSQFQFVNAAQSGWAAFIEDRAVNIGGASATIAWGSTGFATLVLGADTADKTVDFQNPIRFTTATAAVNRTIRVLDGSAGIDARISGGLVANAGDGVGTFTKEGDGTLSLTAPSTITGPTIINSGILRIDHVDALPAGNLTIKNTGVLGLGVADFTRGFGTGPGQVQFQQTGTGNNFGNAGWAAYGANRFVNIGGASAPVTWGDGTFITGGSNLILSYDNSDATIDFQNPINLGAGQRTFSVREGSAAIDAVISSPISGVGGGVVKGQNGTLELRAANTYDGVTTIQNGVLLLTNANSIPGGTEGGNVNTISFTNTGGVIGLGVANFTSDLGTGPGKVQFSATNNHGFAAYGANRIVNLGGASAPVTWGVNNFINGALLLSAVGATHTIDFQNPIDLNGAVRTFNVRDGNAAIDGVVSGVLSGTGGGVLKGNPGTLKLTAANTYDGGTTISSGVLLVSNTSGSGTGSGAVTVGAGTLGGTGSVAGAVTVNTGGHIAPGESVESLDVGALVLNAGSVLDFQLGALGAPGVNSDLLNVLNTDGLTINGGAVALANAGGLAVGTYKLIDYAGALVGDIANLGTPTGPAGFTYGLVNNLGDTSIDLVVSAPAGVPGDYNNNGVVDGADYVVWRKGVAPLPNEVAGVTPGVTTPEDFAAWRERFGNTAGSGASTGLGESPAVPEPTTLLLLCLVLPFVAIGKLGRSRS